MHWNQFHFRKLIWWVWFIINWKCGIVKTSKQPFCNIWTICYFLNFVWLFSGYFVRYFLGNLRWRRGGPSNGNFFIKKLICNFFIDKFRGNWMYARYLISSKFHHFSRYSPSTSKGRGVADWGSRQKLSIQKESNEETVTWNNKSEGKHVIVKGRSVLTKPRNSEIGDFGGNGFRVEKAKLLLEIGDLMESSSNVARVSNKCLTIWWKSLSVWDNNSMKNFFKG